MLRIEHLTKKYGDKVAVSDLSLHIQPGELYGFIGHNGAGKTTTIKCCCGLLSFDEGDIFINGISIKDDPIACKKQFAYIPDTPSMFEYLSGIDYLNFTADIYEVDKETRDRLIEKYAAQFEMTESLGQHISEYSHGMKQKIAIIAALIHQPKLIVLDEPFVGLDPIATYQFKEIMRSVCAEGGAIFFSTHILDVAEKLCDKVAIIKEGRLIVTGTMEEVKGNASLEDTFLSLEQQKDA